MQVHEIGGNVFRHFLYGYNTFVLIQWIIKALNNHVGHPNILVNTLQYNQQTFGAVTYLAQ